MVRILATGLGLGTEFSSSIQQGVHCRPSLGNRIQMKPLVAMASFRRSKFMTTPILNMQVNLSLPNLKFAAFKFFENISSRFGTKENGSASSSAKQLENLDSNPSEDIVEGKEALDGTSVGIEDGNSQDNNAKQIAIRETLIVTLQEESIRAGILDLAGAAGVEEEEKVVTVTPDDMNPSILWEQREKDVTAELERKIFTSPGFSFSAAGLLFPYHLGVCECLIKHGYITEDTPLAGSSAGALVCAVVGGGLSMYDALQATKELAHDCRTYGTAFRLGAVLRNFLERFLPEDTHEKVNGKIRVAVTQVFRQPRGLLVDSFDSKEDLINALHTSCFIPGYLAPRPVTIFRDRVCIDGGLTLFMPPTVADKTVRVCAFPSYAPEGISPDCSPVEGRASIRQLFNWALEPAEDEILDELFLLGYQDALVWVNQQQTILSPQSNGAATQTRRPPPPLENFSQTSSN
jgi:hypothetical protein